MKALILNSILLILLNCFSITYAQDSFTEDFNDNILDGSWYGEANYTLTELNQNLRIAAAVNANSYVVFSRSFPKLDLTTYPFIKVDIKSAAAFNLRIDFMDVNGKITNGQAFNVAISGDNAWHTYTLSYSGRFTQSWPNSSPVDQTQIDKISIFVNAGGAAFNNTFYMDNLLIGSATGIAPPPAGIHLNQIGFYPAMKKEAVIVSAPLSDFYIVSSDKEDTLYTGTLSTTATWNASGETVRIADFSTFNIPGDYYLLVPNLPYSHPFKINSSVHHSLAKAALKSFYFQRCSSPITAACGAPWTRSIGHPDNQVLVHNSAASPYRPTDTKINASGGWYDAGDFNKYVINSGISTHTMLSLYEHYKDFLDTLNLNIPESSNNAPDILDEIRWQMKWLLAMQDPYDGGVYFKLTTPYFDGTIMPSNSTQSRYVIKKTTAAALDFAAVCAQAARVYKDHETEYPGLADSCINAAFKAWKWARKNPSVQYIQSQLTSPTINTGGYGDASFADEFHWAAMELYVTTKIDSFYTLSGSSVNFGAPGWADVRALAYVSLNLHRKNLTPVADTSLFKSRLLTFSNSLRNRVASSAYKIAMGDNDFYWGSNGVAANQAFMLLSAFEIAGDSSFLKAALANLDYLLGRNATNYCFVTGFGNKSPMNIHHAISGADGIQNPIPGLMAGGPNTDQPGDCGAGAYPSTLKAKSYADTYCSYSTNEVAINWNAPLSFAAIGIEAILKGIRANPGTSTVLPTNIATIEEVTATTSAEAIAAKVSFYPNPASSRLTINIATSLDKVILINATGQQVSELSDVSEGEKTIELNKTWQGLHFLLFQKDGIVFAEKVILN